jgi:hypothetical protein
MSARSMMSTLGLGLVSITTGLSFLTVNQKLAVKCSVSVSF